MRSAKESPFPYASPLVCYIAVDQTGHAEQVDHDFTSVSQAYHHAADGTLTLYGVWPGKYHSDLFLIDDLNAFADAFGIPRPDSHVHEVEWALSPFDDGRSSYAYVDIVLKCGCTLGSANIKKFALDMRQQKGWEVATSTGVSSTTSSTGTEYTLRVRRKSLSP